MRNKIKTAIQAFTSKPMLEAARELFKILGYESQRVLIDNYVNFEGFKRSNDTSSFKEDKALVDEWLSINLLFQITSAELNGIKPYVFEHKVKHSFLFMCVELKGHEYSRTKIAQISREINKVYKMPVLILFKYNNLLTLSVMDKRKNKNDDNKDVILKITMIKDISIVSPHRAHLDILLSLSLAELSTEEKKKIENFDDLQKAWEKVLDIQELNKKFYTELSNWYFWAINEVRFPNGAQKGDDKAKEQNEMNLIRMLTRLLFVWFIKEKDLIPRELFELDHLNMILKQEIETKKDSERKAHEQQSIYYKSILQNLFFATLNQEVGKRAFRKKDQNMGADNLMRYKDTFKEPDAFAQWLDDNVPFLNGGLFECLDYLDDTQRGPQGGIVKVKVDGFSDRNDNVISVPDYLFFSAEETANLADDLYDTKKNKVKVHGLINIFNNFKFTIEENTPIEEDIALDPELLGRVFENLLATYNPDTKETARKKTGSFYTPREVVNFMVDESLKAYLIQSLVKEAKMKEEDVEVGIDFLISYNEKEHLFDQNQVEVLIKAIDNCKILDPACGSGAFPMGILHKQVHLLQKLDPDNKRWKERQIKKTESIEVAEYRDEAIKAIETSFQNKGMDYGRKLYLIENCIYGVDIQPIAIQISKLRFFISLIVDQKANENKEDNFGLKALPNLETKFVAANSLIKLEKPKEQITIYDLYQIKDLENELKQIRHRMFSAKYLRKKKELRAEDRKKREEIKSELKKADYPEGSIDNIASWDPYNQICGADWFDAQWMYGIEDGFDIVLGNPPYIQLQSMNKEIKEPLRKQNYVCYAARGDIYSLFYEQGINVLKKNGFLCYITSNKWMKAGYGEKLRGFFAEQNPKLLIDLGGGVFKSASVDTNILLIEKNENKNELKGLNYYDRTKNLNDAVKENTIVITEVSTVAWFIGNSAEISLKEKIERIGKPLKDWDVNINYGIKTGLNEAFIIDTATKERLCAEDPKSAEIIKPILRGRDIKRYSYEWAGLWIIFVPWHFPLHEDSSIQGSSDKAEKEFQIQYPAIYQHLLHYKPALSSRNKAETGIRYEWYALQRCAATYYKEFEKEKIIWAETSSELDFYIDNERYYIDKTCFMLLGKNLKYLCGVINSKLTDFIFRNQIANKLGNNSLQLAKTYVEQISIPLISLSNQIIVNQIETIVCKIQSLKKANTKADTSELEGQIDRLVYQLYDLTKDEIAIIEREDN